MLWFIYIFFLGLIVGSFVNVVIYRIPRGESVVYGRSRCANCGKKIAWYDLIPVVSFFALKARCRQCRQRISWLYPAVELYSGIIFVLAFSFLGQFRLADWLFTVFILESLLILALIDFKNLILPDSVMLAMFAGVIGYGIFERLSSSYRFGIFSINNFIAAAVLFSALFLVWLLSKGAWLGLGDVKLAGLIGLIFGLWGGLIIIYGAIIAGTIVGLFLLANRRANLKTKLPLGSLISFSAMIYVFLGTIIQNKLADFFYAVPLILK